MNTAAMDVLEQVLQDVEFSGYVVRSEFSESSRYICLLYTSPSTRDVEESRMASSA